jgi:putative ABC transport system permease protein
VETFLTRILPDDGRGESILGDLAEEFAFVLERRSKAAARIWYCSQALHVGSRFLFSGGGKRREKKRGATMSTLWRDVKHALRSLLSSPGYTAIVVVTLALGIGANTAVFSLVDALVLRPFPIPDIDRLVMLWETVPSQSEDRGRASPANFLDWKAQSTAFEELVALEWWDVNLTGEGDPERLQGTFASPRFFETLGVEAHLGRTLAADSDSSGARTVVLSYQLFSRRFGSDPSVVGKSVRLNGEPFEVVGVAREGFDYPYGSELWAPLWLDAETAALRDAHYLDVIGKLEPGGRVEDARAEMDVVAERLAREHPKENAGRGVRTLALARAVIDLGAPAFLAVWQSTTLFVLLIACVNVANLLLARGADRQKELSLQQALGAGRPRIVRQLLTESLVLSLAGAFLALPLAWFGMDLLRSGLPPEVQRFVVGWREIDLDLRLLAFTAAISLLTTLVFGLVPALRASRSDLTSALKEGGRGGSEGAGRHRFRGFLVAGEVALALMLLIASGLCIRGTLRLAYGDHGYDPENLLTFEISLPERQYKEDEARREFYRSVVEGVRGIPGVVSADAANVLPSSGNNHSRAIDIEGRTIENPSERPLAHYRVITDGYFETLRIPRTAGRTFGTGDRKDTAPVAIVSEKFAERYWPGEDPIGRRFRAGTDEEPWLTVVGIVGDVLHDWFLREPQPTFYVPMEQQNRSGMLLAIRTLGEPEAITAAARTVVRRVDPDQPIYHTITMRQLRSERMIGVKYAAIVMGVMGIIALVLAAVGIYGMMAYSVSRRTHEIGLRVALGAGRSDVLRLTVGQALSITLSGVAIGLVLAYGAGRLMASNLFGVVRLEAATFVVLALVLGSVSLLAAYLPARRALAVDPASALRAE